MSYFIDKCHQLSYTLSVKHFEWDSAKNEWLKEERNVSFEEVLTAIDQGNILATLDHPNQARYSGQQMYVINIHNYAYVVPFVEDNDKRFLKTIFPSRKMTEKYIIKEKK